MINGVLLDLAGVIYEADQAVPGAGDAISQLRSAQLPVRFVTNTTRTKKQTLVSRLTRLRLPIKENEIFTPARAACEWLQSNNRSPHLLVHPNLKDEFNEAPQGQKTAVVIGDAAEAFDYQSMNAAYRELSKGADFLALAENRIFKDDDGELSLDAGPFVKALEYASGRKSTVLGKPSRDFFSMALSSMGSSFKHAIMVGDDMEADVAGALNAGINQAILVRTGKYRPGDEKRFEPPPTQLVADISKAVEWIITHRN